MAKQFFGFFDSVDGDVRQYDAAEMAQILSAAVQNGISSHQGGGLRVSAGGGMDTIVSFGGAVINGYVFVLGDDGSGAYRVSHQVAGSADRIDRVVLRLDMNQRSMLLEVLTGVPGAAPVPPALTRTSQVWELSLAQVRIRASAASVEEGDITDERSDEDACGYAVPAVLSGAQLDERYVCNEPITSSQIDLAIV